MQDKQKQKVYRWEGKEVAPHDKTIVLFDNIQSIVNYVWADFGLEHPPLVGKQFHKKTTKADATRLVVRFGEKTHTWIILHELSHSATSLCSGESNHHGSLFMGIYLQLLHRYLHLDLIESAKQAGLHIKEDAIPVFLED
jgi:hypothetical protein